jgi:two-component system, response regulator YesN
MNILIVEDEYITRTFISSLIKWKDHNMYLIGTVKDGQEALDIIKNKDVDIVITDLKMPRMDGNTLIKELKNYSFNGKIIVLSNYDDFSSVKEAMKNGVFEYLLKVTINKDELLDVSMNAKQELKKLKKLDRKNQIDNISNEKLKVHEYLEKYLKFETNVNLEEEIKNKYLTDCSFIYIIAVGIDIESVEKEKKLNKLITNIVNNYALHIKSNFVSIINIKRNEYAIIIKHSEDSDLKLLVSNIKRNVNQYLGINFEEIIYKNSIQVEEI